MSRPLPVYYTAEEAARVLRSDIWEVARLCRTDVIKASKPHGKWLIAHDDLIAFVERQGDAA